MTADEVAARRRRSTWPTWSAYLALAWSVGYGAVALAWALGAPGFPFGRVDPEAADMGSVLYAVEPGPGGIAIAVACLVGALTAAAMLHPGARWAPRPVVLGVAWTLAAVLMIVLPDIRLLQNFAYALMFVFVKVDWFVLNQALLVAGGISFAAAALGYQRRTRDACAFCGRPAHPDRPHDTDATDPGDAAEAGEPAIVRWGRIAAWVAFIAPIPYGITRLAWAFGIPLGIDQDPSLQPLGARIGETALALLAIGGGVLTLGLIRPWGEIWPRWVPFLAGRRVPVAFPTIVGGLVAILVTVGGFTFVRIDLMGEWGLRPVAPEPPTVTGWAAGSPGYLWPFWGIALTVAVIAYYYRRRGRCTTCHRG